MPHGYPDCFCEHGNKPEYCGKCLINGAVAPFVHKGTGNENLLPFSPYVYIHPTKSKESPDEDSLLTELEEQQPAATPPALAKTESIEVLKSPPGPKLDEPKIEVADLCPHDGFIINGLTYCGHCTKDSTGAIATHFMYTDLLQICDQEGQRHSYYRVDFKDQRSHAIEAVWSKLAVILAANNPRALARKIARDAASDLRKKADNWKLVPVSDGGNSGGRGRVTPSADFEGNDMGGGGWLELRNFEIQENSPYPVGGIDFDMPGGERFWLPPNLRQLENALCKAMAALPRPPQHRVPMAVDMMIKRWVGYFPEIGEQSYDTIGQLCDPVTDARRVKYLIQKGIRDARDHILQITGDAARAEIEGVST
jgi:hypothetical protein